MAALQLAQLNQLCWLSTNAMKPYANLSAKSQIGRIRKALNGVVEAEWGMQVSSLRLVSHDYNTTFQVDGDRGRYALRVNVASTRPPEKMLTEIAFVQHLSAAKTFKVAAPIPKAADGFIATIDVPNFGRPVFAVLYEWLSDPTVGDKPTPEVMLCLGRATKELHSLANSFVIDGFPFPTLTEPYYGDPYRLHGQDLDVSLFDECANRTMQVFAKLESLPKIPIHADLHLYNLKFGQGGLSIFDFDDAMVSWPIMDAAITMWYCRYHGKSPELEAYYWQGFGSTADQFGLSPEEFETLVAARTLLLVNDIVSTRNADAKDGMIPFIRRCEALMRHYLKTGRFAPWEVPDLPKS
jgi:Ser/Thr protein kinase RdoA (MazF antagonist)